MSAKPDMWDDEPWEVEIKIRRRGRLVRWERATGAYATEALYAVHNDLERWAEDQPRRDGDE